MQKDLLPLNLMKRLIFLLTLCLLLPLPQEVAAKNTGRAMVRLADEFRHEDGVEVMDLGRIALSLMRAAAKASASSRDEKAVLAAFTGPRRPHPHLRLAVRNRRGDPGHHHLQRRRGRPRLRLRNRPDLLPRTRQTQSEKMNRDAFIATWIPLSDNFFRLAMHLLGDEAAARDAVQDLLLKLWVRRDRLEGIAHPEAYGTTLLRKRS